MKARRDLDEEPLRWLPFPQYSPSEPGEYLVTLKSLSTGNVFTSTATWHERKCWALAKFRVLAWMFVPAPYQEAKGAPGSAARELIK